MYFLNLLQSYAFSGKMQINKIKHNEIMTLCFSATKNKIFYLFMKNMSFRANGARRGIQYFIISWIPAFAGMTNLMVISHNTTNNTASSVWVA